MIYFDSNKNKLIPIDKKDIDINIKNKSNECELVIRFYCSELSHFKEWFNDSNQERILSGWSRRSEYKRDIFISDLLGKDMKFCNCYLTSFNLYDYTSKFEVLLRCDYYETNGTYPELKAIYRNIKIDSILK